MYLEISKNVIVYIQLHFLVFFFEFWSKTHIFFPDFNPIFRSFTFVSAVPKLFSIHMFSISTIHSLMLWCWNLNNCFEPSSIFQMVFSSKSKLLSQSQCTSNCANTNMIKAGAALTNIQIYIPLKNKYTNIYPLKKKTGRVHSWRRDVKIWNIVYQNLDFVSGIPRGMILIWAKDIKSQSDLLSL